MSAISFPAVPMADAMPHTGRNKRSKEPALVLLPIVFILSIVAAFAMNQVALGQADDGVLAAPVEQSADSIALEPESMPVISAAPVAGGEALTPRMRAVMEHVAQRYRVAASTLRPIFGAAQVSARERGLDPLLIVAVIGIESSFNPQAESSYGAQGLMQVVPRFHLNKVPQGAGAQPFFDPVTNVYIGGHVLQEAIRRRGSLIAGLQYYGGSSDPQAPYAVKVIAEKARLEQVAARIEPSAV